MARLFTNLKSGDVDDNPLLIGATVINSAEFANLPVVAGGDTLTLTLDPLNAGAGPELVTVTAHSASATTVTVTRAAHGTTAKEHALNTPWVAGLVAADLERLDAIEADGWVTNDRILNGTIAKEKIASVNASDVFADASAPINISGTAAKATILETSRTFDITGDITAPAVGFDGSSNVNLVATVDVATKLRTARTIQLSSDVTGSASFDGSGNINIVTTVGDNSHAHTGTTLSAIPASDITAGTFGTGTFVFPGLLRVTGNIEAAGVLRSANSLLRERFQIEHSTLQLEPTDFNIINGLETR